MSAILYAPIPDPECPDKNNYVRWPEHWPKHYNGTHKPCDMLVGPCSCGAAHYVGEFRLRLNPVDRRSEMGKIERTS